MTAKKKNIINAKRKAKAASGKVKNVQRKLSHAQMEAQIAALEEQIALLQGEGQDQSSKFKVQSGEDQSSKFKVQSEEDQSSKSKVQSEEDQSSKFKVQSGQDQSSKFKVQSGDANQNHSELCTLNSRVTHPVPVMRGLFAVGPQTIRVMWDMVPGVGSYIVRISSDPEGANVVKSLTLPADSVAVDVTGLEPDTTYYVSLRSNALSTSGDVNSAYSAAVPITTPDASQGGNGVVGDLQNWLDALRGVDEQLFSSLPQFGNIVLSSSERRRALGSGVRRYGFIDKVSDVATAYPQFWPAYSTIAGGTSGATTSQEKLKELIREIEVLRNLLLFFESGSRNVLDMLLTAGNEAFQLANMYYGSVRSAARQQIPDAEAVFKLLRSFWHRRRRTTDEPTEHEIERDARALLRGSKDGTIRISNESDQIVRGEKVLVDHTFPKPRGGVKVVESAEIKAPVPPAQ